MDKESGSALKTMLGIGIGGAAGAALGYSPLGKILVKKLGFPLGSQVRNSAVGSTVGMSLGGGLGGSLANFDNPESLIGGDIGASTGIVGGALAGAPSLFKNARITPQSALLKYLLSVGGGMAIGGGLGSYVGSKTGINDKIKSLY
jgi:hypothetical protein